MGFCEQLKAARKRKGYTQQEVADKMQIDKSTYCGYETGKRQPDVSKIKALSSILDISCDELLETGFAESIPVDEVPEKSYRTRPEIRRLLHLCQDEPKEKIETVIRVLDALKDD